MVEHELLSETELLSRVFILGPPLELNCLKGLNVIKQSRVLLFAPIFGVFEQFDLDLCLCIELFVGIKIKGGTIGLLVILVWALYFSGESYIISMKL